MTDDEHQVMAKAHIAIGKVQAKKGVGELIQLCSFSESPIVLNECLYCIW